MIEKFTDFLPSVLTGGGNDASRVAVLVSIFRSNRRRRSSQEELCRQSQTQSHPSHLTRKVSRTRLHLPSYYRHCPSRLRFEFILPLNYTE